MATSSDNPLLQQQTDQQNPLLEKKKTENPLLAKPQAAAKSAPQPTAPPQNPMDVPGVGLGLGDKQLGAPGEPPHTVLQQVGGVPEYTASVPHLIRMYGPMGAVKKVLSMSPAEANDRYGFNAPQYLRYVVNNTPKSSWENRWASYNITHPAEAGLETFGWEFINPGNALIGGGTGKLGDLLYNFMSGSVKGRAFLNALSPYRSVAAAGGQGAKHGLQAMVNTVRKADEIAWDSTYRIFKGLTPEEQWDVVRRMQRGHVVPPGYDKTRLESGQTRLPGEGSGEADYEKPEGGAFVPGEGIVDRKIAQRKNLDQRANILYQTLRTNTRLRLEEGTLKTGQVFDEQQFFPMYGAYLDPKYNQDPFDFIQGLRNMQRGVDYTLPPIRQKHFTNIDEALGSGMLNPRATAASQMMKFLSRSYQNMAANRSIESLPESIIQKWPPELKSVFQKGSAEAVPDIMEKRGGPTLPKEYSQTALPKGTSESTALAAKGTSLVPKADLAIPEGDVYKAFRKAAKTEGPPQRETIPQGWVRAEDALGQRATLVPALRGTIIRQEFAGWMKKHAGSMLSGTPNKLLGMFDNENMAKWVDRYNAGFRQAIIANPAYHLMWNIVWNGSAALGQSPRYLVGGTARALLGVMRSTIPGLDKMLEEKGSNFVLNRFMHGSEDYTEALNAAIKDGATAEFGSTRASFGTMKAIDLMTQPWSKLTFTQKMDRFATSLSDWNKRAVFGKNGEQAFAVRLHSELIKRGYEPGRAAELTREALGNYQNVDPNDVMSQLFFFYPWLKSNTQFWMKKFITNPAYTQAPLQGIRRNNQLAGDPGTSDMLYPTQDYTVFTGTKDKPSYFTPALPQRTPDRITNAVARLFGREHDVMGGMRELHSIISSHATPAAALGADLGATYLEQQKADIDPHVGSNYDVIFEKDAPVKTQLNDFKNWLVTHAIPIPLAQYTIEDMVRRGVNPFKNPNELRAQLLQIGGGGYPYSRLSAQAARQLGKQHQIFETAANKARKQYENRGITYDQMQANIDRAYKSYEKQRNRIQAEEEKQ